MSQYKDCMTNDMLEVYGGFEEEMESECLFCLEKLKQANIAENISLPHENERGTLVKHGARMVMNRISEYWYQRMCNARSFVSKEFEEKHELWNRRAGIEIR